MKSKYVFGPIGSRRLGVSLGVDLVTRKTCTQDCPYCEAGWTTLLTMERREYVPVDEVIAQLDNILSARPQLDFITFSGAGEPTLNSRLGDVVAFVKNKYPEYKLCLLTNGTLLGNAAVAREVEGVDLVIPNLDASNSSEFAKISRPAPGIIFEDFIDGLIRFTHNHKGLIYLEIFIAPGINDSSSSISRFCKILNSLRVDKVQLNTLDRPGCDASVKPASTAVIHKFIAAFEQVVPVEAVGCFRYKSPELRGTMPPDELSAGVLEVAGRRQVTRADLLLALKCDADLLDRILNDLVQRGLIECERGNRGEFFGFFK